MSKKATLARNTGILAVGKFSSQLITFLMLPVYTSYLSPSEYGIVDVVITYVALLAPVVTIQMEMAVFRFLIDVRNDKQGATRVISSALQVAVAMLIPFSLIAVIVHFFVEIPYFSLILGIICSAVLSGLCLQAARGFGKNVNFTIASIIMGVTTVLSNVILIVFVQLGAAGLLISMLVAHLASAAYLILSLRLFRYVRIGGSDAQFKKSLLKYSAPLVPNGISWWVINAADRTIITLFLGLTSNGIYAIASRFPFIFTAVFAVFGLSWTEAASVHIDSKDRDQFFSDVFNTAFRFFGAIGLGIIAFLPFIFPLLINTQFSSAYTYIPIMLLGAIFNSVVGLYSAIYVAKKMTVQVATTSIMAAIISISINLLLINIIGLFAAAIANATAFLAMAVYRHYDLKKYVKITYSKLLIGLLVIAYVAVISSYYLNNFCINIVTASLVTFFAVILNRDSLAKFFQAIKSKPSLKSKMDATSGNNSDLPL